jgi:hypothetical protein
MVLSQSPSKAMATLEHDASELIAAGMVTLNAKFFGVEDEKLIARVVEIWGFFWDQVLPYVEGVSWVESFCCCWEISYIPGPLTASNQSVTFTALSQSENPSFIFPQPAKHHDLHAHTVFGV